MRERGDDEMIQMEYPKLPLDGLTPEEKVVALKRQVDILTDNLQIVLNSIEDDMENVTVVQAADPGGGGEVISTSIPTANTISKFDPAAHMNSADMSSSDITSFIDSLNGTPVAPDDYVVEQGASGIWTYRKWNSGIAECWGYSDLGDITIGNVYGSVYYAYASSMDYPFAFSSAPSLLVTAHSVGGRVWASPYPHPSASRTPQITIFAPVSLTNQRVYVIYHAMGRWK